MPLRAQAISSAPSARMARCACLTCATSSNRRSFSRRPAGPRYCGSRGTGKMKTCWRPLRWTTARPSSSTSETSPVPLPHFATVRPRSMPSHGRRCQRTTSARRVRRRSSSGVVWGPLTPGRARDRRRRRQGAHLGPAPAASDRGPDSRVQCPGRNQPAAMVLAADRLDRHLLRLAHTDAAHVVAGRRGGVHLCRHHRCARARAAAATARRRGRAVRAAESSRGCRR